MAEPTQIVFSFKEIVEALVKQHDIHEGIWGLFVRFGVKATNMGANENELRPSAIIPILELGLQKFEKENNLSIDAGKINPRASHNKPRTKPN